MPCDIFKDNLKSIVLIAILIYLFFWKKKTNLIKF